MDYPFHKFSFRRWRPYAVSGALSFLGLWAAPSAFAVIYWQDFETDDTANWTVNDPGLTDTTVDFHYDYAAIGVPAAPSGTGTRGLKMAANNTDGVFGGFSVSPTGQNFTGNYTVAFDIWSNYVGPLGPGGSGSTQLSYYGVGTDGQTAAWAGAGAFESVTLGTTLDGGSSADYRVYSSAAPFVYPEGNPVYSSGGFRNGSDGYYSVFAAAAAPANQTTLYPNQTGVTDPGETAFRWSRVEITMIAGTLTWVIDGLEIASLDTDALTLGGGNILFGHSDTNAGSSTDPNAALLNVTLIDNITVTAAVPEPNSFFLFLGGSLGLHGFLRRRKKRR